MAVIHLSRHQKNCHLTAEVWNLLDIVITRLSPDFSGRAVACRALNRILETQSAETVAILFS